MMILLLVFSEGAFGVAGLLPLLFLLRREAVEVAGVGDSSAILGCFSRFAKMKGEGRSLRTYEPKIDGRRTGDSSTNSKNYFCHARTDKSIFQKLATGVLFLFLGEFPRFRG